MVTLTDETCTHNIVGNRSNISQGNFGDFGEMNFFRAFRFDKNGIQENETSKLAT